MVSLQAALTSYNARVCDRQLSGETRGVSGQEGGWMGEGGRMDGWEEGGWVGGGRMDG